MKVVRSADVYYVDALRVQHADVVGIMRAVVAFERVGTDVADRDKFLALLFQHGGMHFAYDSETYDCRSHFPSCPAPATARGILT